MQETRNNCFGSKKRSTTLLQGKTGKHECRNVTATYGCSEFLASDGVIFQSVIKPISCLARIEEVSVRSHVRTKSQSYTRSIRKEKFRLEPSRTSKEIKNFDLGSTQLIYFILFKFFTISVRPSLLRFYCFKTSPFSRLHIK